MWVLFLLARADYNPGALFYTGAKVLLPPELAAHTARVADPVGYDAQYYHVIAHDPWNRRGFVSYADNGPLRWRRIGMPAAAWALGLGRDESIDWAWIALQIGFVSLGAWWLGAWAPALLLIPATLVSLDRMTVDLALVVCAIGILRFPQSRWVYALLLAAPLIRETGILLVAGFVLYRRDWRAILCALPAIAWWLYVRSQLPPDGTAWFASWPLAGLVARTLEPLPGRGLAWLTEQIALAGYWLAMLLPFWALRRRYDLPEITAVCIALFFAALGRSDIWDSAYATGRTLSPVLVMLGSIAIRDRQWLFAAPTLLILPRILLQFAAQLRP